mmetsp:Transcript_6594/g.9644  ORF Transcript_6594/g.9644 Transcript_6594/m.9644 type:complete len:182 (+) Transcript_6594:41-586(+)|eukprot:CAMPEP_0196812290 /NCGR_PEP_ID=MMETSP1362-20130617/24171_1 /TAXON_ID=163516 /ORGANISM="Leptocylindrus danicus, Strain CCMP1856" /LENGTH=181 /DNA_ID=CAMNT_0042187853 /DNA_START=35 /DNA_END=580 /DNA_ORIENTATION=+
MSEESKTPDGDYVHMFDGAAPTPAPAPQVMAQVPDGLDDPNLSQEEKDLRLAIALQQQENATALQHSKQAKERQAKSSILRTGRSGAQTKLAAVREKDHGQYKSPYADNAPNDVSQYQAPAGTGANSQELSDYQLAVELQKVEASSAGSAKLAQELSEAEKKEKEANLHRASRSGAGRGFA